MPTQITHRIRVTVISNYEAEISLPNKDKYVHSYHVTIENQGFHKVQLLRRHWIITDANNVVREVKGEGVIGLQPILNPEEIHQYQSWSPVPTPIGKMKGSYLMKNLEDDSLFEVEVPEFSLVADFKLN